MWTNKLISSLSIAPRHHLWVGIFYEKIFAHRGVSSLAPENTLPAFRMTCEFGVKWIEADADVLSDIIIHDSTLDRCSDQTGIAFELGRENLKTIDAGGWFSDEFVDARIPTLDELIHVVNKHELNLNLELKSYRTKQSNEMLIKGVMQSLKKLNPERQLIVSCFNHLLLVNFKKAMPEADVACLFETATLREDWPAIMEMVDAKCIHPQNEGLSKESVQAMKQHGYDVHVWTVNSLARANELFNWGVDSIFTDVPQNAPKKHRYI